MFYSRISSTQLTDGTIHKCVRSPSARECRQNGLKTRRNILRQTAPDFINLLSDQSLFSNHETGRLFGEHFLKALSKEADEESRIAKVGRNGGSHQRSKRY